MERFRSDISFAGETLPQENIEKLVLLVSEVEVAKDVCSLILLLLGQNP